MNLLHKLLLSTIVGLNFLQASSYTVDASHSDIGFKVKHLSISYVKGNFKKFDGHFTIDETTKIFSSLEGTVDVTSITTHDIKRDAHLQDKDFLDIQKHPKMYLKFLKQDANVALFTLTIKGISKEVAFNIQEISNSIQDPWGNTRLAFVLEGSINRKDFNMTYSKLLETGGLLVGNTVKLHIFIEGIENKKST